MRPRRRLMGRDGRSSLPSAASPGVRPMSTRTSTPSSPRSGRSPASAALFLLGSAPPDTPRPKKGYLFAPSSPTLNVRTFRETGYGKGMPVAGLVAARERRQDGQADDEEIGSVALATPCAGRAWPFDRGRRELGRSGDRIAERPASSGQPDLSGARPTCLQLSAGRPFGYGQRRRSGHDRRRLGERVGLWFGEPRFL